MLFLVGPELPLQISSRIFTIYIMSKLHQVPKFKAQPLPDFHEVHLPEKKVLEPTKPAPFKLMVDERGAVKGERWEQQVSILGFFFMRGIVTIIEMCIKLVYLMPVY